MKNKRKTIQSRLILLLVMVLVPVIGIQAYMYYGAFKERKAAELRSNLEIARAVAKSFDTFVKDVLRLELAVGLALTSSPRSNREDENRILLRTREDNPELWEIFWVSPKGVVLSATGTQFLGINFADREYFKEIVAGREYVISDLLLSRTTRKPSFTISRAIRDEKGLLIGVVTIGILPERLDKALGVERFKGGGFAVVDSKGMLVFRYPVIETTWEERNVLKQYPQFGDALKGKEVSATVYAPFEGKNRMVGFAPIPSIGWAASAGQREEEVTGPILAAIGRNAAITGLILAMAFFIALSLARRLANPIMMLRQYALALGRGQARQPLPAQSVSELNDLADAFNTMDANVRVREIALQESEQRWAITLASIGDAVIAVDVAGRITFMNAVAEELTGWTLSDAAAKSVPEVFNIINEQTRREVENPVAKVLREGMVVGLANHTILVKKDGTEVPIDDSGAPIRGADGETLGVVLVFRDITERKQAEEELHKSRIDMGRAQEVGQIGSWRLDIRHNVLTWSDENHRIFGVTKGTPLTYEAFLAIIHPDDRQYVDTQWNAGLAGEPYDIEHRIVVNGQVRWVREKAYLEFDDTGALLGGFGITQDITERKHTEEDLQEAKAKLEQRVQERTYELSEAYETLQKETDERKKTEEHLVRVQKLEALGTLAGGIAHDFNNILAGIIGFTEMVLEDVNPDSPEYKRLELALKGANRGRDLVRQILAFSRQSLPDRKTVVLSQSVEEGLKLLRPTLPSTIEIVSRRLTEDDIVLADAAQIHQILMNLCMNAAHAMREKGGVLNISISDTSLSEIDPAPVPEMRPGEYVVLKVSDTGCGMDPATLERIFDPFFTTKEQGEGTGLGLSVVHGIIKSHDGYVTAESESGKGSTFYVYIPKIKEQKCPEDSEPLPVIRGKERILFVDDEDMLVELNEQRLSRLGYEVVATTSSMEALAIFRKEPESFDLVVTDYTMPNMTGMDLAVELLKVRATIPIVLCTGHSETVSPELSKEAGIREYLMKPLAKQELAEAVRRVLDKKQESQ